MLWHKAWLETRGRFLAGLAISLIVGFGVIYDFRATERLLPLVRNVDLPRSIPAARWAQPSRRASRPSKPSAVSSGGSGTART